jgi:hypothetical protein
MKYEDFLKALDHAGWEGTSDAQYNKIRLLHQDIWPVIAELERDIFELDCIVNP